MEQINGPQRAAWVGRALHPVALMTQQWVAQVTTVVGKVVAGVVTMASRLKKQ